MHEYYQQFLQYTLAIKTLIVLVSFFSLLCVLLIIFISIERLVRNISGRIKHGILQLYENKLSEIVFSDTLLDESISEEIKVDLIKREFMGINTSTPYRRYLLRQCMLDLNQNLVGEVRDALGIIYRTLDLDRDALRAVKLAPWHYKASALKELSSFKIQKCIPFAESYINSSNVTLRREALLALIRMNPELAGQLINIEYSVNAWERLLLLELILPYTSKISLNLQPWLFSENDSLIILALQLIRFMNLTEYISVLEKLLFHKNDYIRGETIKALRAFNHYPIKDKLIEDYKTETSANKTLILEAFADIGNENDLGFLETVAKHDLDFSHRMKALHAMKESSFEGEEVLNKWKNMLSDATLNAMVHHQLDTRIG